MAQTKKKEVIYNRSLPSNNDAERTVLGCILLDSDNMNAAHGKIIKEDFFNNQNGIIFEAMEHIHAINKEINNITVVEELKRMNYPNVDEIEEYLIDLVDSVPSLSTIDAYLDVVSDNALQRNIYAKMTELADGILSHKDDATTLIEKVEKDLIEVIKKRKTAEFKIIGDIANEVYDEINGYIGQDRTVTGLDTGFTNLNKITLGFHKGELIILAARPAVGKSAYALNLAMQIATQNPKACVAFFSLEMSNEQILMRDYAYLSHVPLKRIKNGQMNQEEIYQLAAARDQFTSVNPTTGAPNYNIYLTATTSTSIADIRMRCRQLKQEGHLDFVVVDYLQLIVSPNFKGSRQEEVSQISRQLKTLAQELEVPILALSQLSRNVEMRGGEPQMSDLGEPGSIEQDADMVFFLFKRSDIEGKTDEDDKQAFENDNHMEPVVLKIAKNRQGEQGYIDYNFYGAFCTFNEQPKFKKFITPEKKQPNNGVKNIKEQI